MRWTWPKDGDWRYVNRFLWVPIRIGRERRWLERARLHQRYNPRLGWVNIGFADNELLNKIIGEPPPGQLLTHEEAQERAAQGLPVQWSLFDHGGWITATPAVIKHLNHGYYRVPE